MQAQNRKLREKNVYLKQALSEVLNEVDDSIKDESLVEENKLLSEKVSKLKEEVNYLKNEIEMKDACLDALKKETFSVEANASSDSIVPELKQKVAQLETDLAKCFHGEGTLNALHAQQKSSLDKEGLGYGSANKKKVFQSGYKRTPMKYKMPYEKCQDCGKSGHTNSASRLCGIKGHDTNSATRSKSVHKSVNIVQMWIKKSDRHLYKIYDTNIQGPKVTWVPKR